MIQLVIASKSDKQLEDIAEYLLKNHLIISVDFHMNIRRFELENEALNSYYIHYITGKTKSLLFMEIDLKLREKYKDNVPEIYSHPIINMDWRLANKLKMEVEKSGNTPSTGAKVPLRHDS